MGRERQDAAMIVRLYGFNVRNRPAGIALAAVALSLGLVFVAFGIVLLLGVAAVGAVVGAAVVLVRSLTGRGSARPGRPRPDRELDPALEVFPVDHAAAKPLPNHTPANSQAH
jgi:hypothetical protein